MIKFLNENNLDYVIINSTNKFLVEYNELQHNSRYHLTGFSGSTGDVLVSKDDITLFVDGRYHEQADRECDLDKITVFKLKDTQTFINETTKLIQEESTLGFVAHKTSVFRYQQFKEILKEKKVTLKLLKNDPFEKEQTSEQKVLTSIPTTITGKSSEQKISEIQNTISEGGAYFFTNLEEVSYLTNLRDFSKDFNTAINGKMLISREKAILFCDDKITELTSKIEIKPLNDFVNHIEGLKIIFYDKISTNMEDFTLFADIAQDMSKNPVSLMKSQKTDAEINHYIDCFNRTDKAVNAIREYIENNENLSEKDIADKLKEYYIKFGAKGLSFNSIVAKDCNAALAHYSKSSPDEILKDGSLVLIDSGAYYEGGYATDITRVFVKGEPNVKQKLIYTLVLKSFLKAFNTQLTEMTTGYDIGTDAKSYLDSLAPEGFVFNHGLGHGIGISVHENPPRLSTIESSKTILKENMCFTIEPGLYCKDFGGVRLENSVYIKGGKIKSFVHMCYEKKLIDESLLNDTEKQWLSEFEVK